MNESNENHKVIEEFLTDRLNDAEIYLLERLKDNPFRFDSTAPQAPTVALMISRLFAMDLVYVDKDEDRTDAIITLSRKGHDFVQSIRQNYMQQLQ